MLYAIPDRRLANARRLALGDIFATVHSDDSDITGVLLFDLPQLREDVNAVDSAIGPEVEQDDFATQLRQCEWVALRVDPVESRREIWSANARQL